MSIILAVIASFTKLTMLIMIPVVLIAFGTWLIIKRKIKYFIIFFIFISIIISAIFYIENYKKDNYKSVWIELERNAIKDTGKPKMKIIY